MQSVRTWLGLVGGLVPVVYCIGFALYFLDVGGWGETVVPLGLQPTIIGLGIVGLIFAIVLGFRIRRAFPGSQPPQANGGGPGSSPGDPDDAAGRERDTDATIARYLAQRAAEQSLSRASSPPPGVAARPAGGTTFGRRGR